MTKKKSVSKSKQPDATKAGPATTPPPFHVSVNAPLITDRSVAQMGTEEVLLKRVLPKSGRRNPLIFDPQRGGPPRNT